MRIINSIEEFEIITQKSKAAVVYFSHDACSVCKVLLPKIKELLKSNFPKTELFYCNTQTSPTIAAQNRIFTVPSVLVYFDGKLHGQFSRNLGIDELRQCIERPYHLIFS